MFPGIVSALDYMHNVKKIAHRDIKPENIVLTSNSVPKFTSFGTAAYANPILNQGVDEFVKTFEF